jgi:ABC-type oligopeptide transport system substrate-binding subunit
MSCQLVNSVLGRVGTISGRAWAGTIDSPPNYDVGRAILSIVPSVAGNGYIITDKTGSFSLPNVPAGDYKITPIDVVGATPTKVTVTKDQTSTINIAFTSGLIQFYLVNTTLSSPPLNNKAVRQALIQAVDRAGLVSSIPLTGRSPADDLIPPSLNEGGWADGANKVTYSQSEANTALNAAVGSPFSISLLVNDSGTNLDVANALAADFQALDRVSASLDVETWDYVKTTGYTQGNFQLVRAGWAVDTNNLVDMFDFIYHTFNPGKYTSDQVQPLIDQGNAALDNGDIDGYHKAVIALNNLWLDDGALIPLDSQ